MFTLDLMDYTPTNLHVVSVSESENAMYAAMRAKAHEYFDVGWQWRHVGNAIIMVNLKTKEVKLMEVSEEES